MILDIPEMGYTQENTDFLGNETPKGELLIRGNNLFEGYYLEPEQSKLKISNNRWLHTGDIGNFTKFII